MLEELSKVSKIEFRIDNPFPKDHVAKDIFLELINKNKKFRTPLITKKDIFITYEGNEWTQEVETQLKEIITFDLIETRKLISEIAEHELVRGF